MDIHLPDADGLDVLRILRADARTAKLPIVALSASVMEWERTAALSAGATLYGSKPIDIEPFKKGVSAILREDAGASIPPAQVHTQNSPSTLHS